MGDVLRPIPLAGTDRVARSLGTWLSRFTATFLGVVLGGGLLLVGVHEYARWRINQVGEAATRSLERQLDQINSENAAKLREIEKQTKGKK